MGERQRDINKVKHDVREKANGKCERRKIVLYCIFAVQSECCEQQKVSETRLCIKTDMYCFSWHRQVCVYTCFSICFNGLALSHSILPFSPNTHVRFCEQRHYFAMQKRRKFGVALKCMCDQCVLTQNSVTLDFTARRDISTTNSNCTRTVPSSHFLFASYTFSFFSSSFTHAM